jgi:hypothetical protein
MEKGKEDLKKIKLATIKMSRCKELPKCLKQCVKLHHPLIGSKVEKENLAKGPSKKDGHLEHNR